ncbi:MAG: sel1 repeat family protein [Burkholderiales bacterium]|nr:sel1 repeat family protein [Burkholderiales bacterium]
MTRILAAVLALVTLATIGWYAYWVVPQTRLLPDSGRFVLLYFGALALPYCTVSALLAWRDGGAGLRLALGTALVNAVWALPLAAMAVLFGAFTLGNRDKEEQVIALALGALAQLPLAAVAAAGLRRAPARSAAGAAPATAWLLAFALPAAVAAASLVYYNWQAAAFKARSAQAAANARAAQETLKLLQSCLAGRRAGGYPARLDDCPEAAARMGDASGYRFTYLAALPAADGRRAAYLVCAQPLRFRATGFDTIVADGTSLFGLGAGENRPPENPPTCASVLDPERAIAWCAWEYAAREETKGYPRRFADIAPCVVAQRRLRENGAERVAGENGEGYAYLSDSPDRTGRITRFRIYRLGLTDGAPAWMDHALARGPATQDGEDAVLRGLPEAAAPQRFEAGCAGGRGEECFLAGYEWRRKARQAGLREDQPPAARMNRSALAAFERGCTLDDARSCVSLARELARGLDAERDVIGAAGAYEKACELGRAEGCRHAAEMHESGRKARAEKPRSRSTARAARADLPRDAARAAALYGRACELGDRTACFIAARLLAAGEGIAPDREKAFGLYARVCDDGMAFACTRAATLSSAREQDYLRRGCVLGDADACTRAGR